MITETIKKFVGRLFAPAARGPLRIGRDKHGIDRRNVSRHAIKVCEVLRQHGYDAYIVGGAVRDLIVGLEPKDFDVATNATPEQIRPLFRRARIIGRRFQLVHVVFGQEIIETSTFRAPASEDQETDAHGRILRDNVFGTHEEDAARRDFTMNALYYDPHNEEVIDFHNGVADLKKRQIRIIGDPAKRYREDPVRMLRAVRFAAKLNGTIDPATRQPIRTMADEFFYGFGDHLGLGIYDVVEQVDHLPAAFLGDGAQGGAGVSGDRTGHLFEQWNIIDRIAIEKRFGEIRKS